MAHKIPAVFCWSGGKDSAYALYNVLQEGLYEVKYLLSTFNGNHRRLSMHGVREELIEQQSVSIGIPLLKVYVYEADNIEYERAMGKILTQLKGEGIEHAIYGDIFLEDLRQYREDKMKAVGMQCVFPLWGKNTRLLVDDFIRQGFKTLVCCINDGYLDESFCGQLVDHAFVEALPEGVDPCGENGEFHTFCFDGPIYQQSIAVKLGERTYKPLMLKLSDHPTPIKDVGTRGFWFHEILPV